MKETVKDAIAEASALRIFRALSRFLSSRGPLLCAGIAYMGLFSITAMLTVGWAFFSSLLGRHPSFLSTIIDTVNQQIPGLLKTTNDPEGLIDPSSLVNTPGTSATGWIALGVAIISASTVIWYLGLAIRSMFGLENVREHLLSAILGRFFGLFVLIFGVVVTAVLTSLTTFLSDWFVKVLGEEWSTLVDVLAYGIPFVMDLVIFILMVRVVAGVRPPKRDMAMGALIAAMGSGLLRSLGQSIISRVSDPVLGAAASVATIMLWINFLGWITLYAAAWASNPPPSGHPKLTSNRYATQRPNFITMSTPDTLNWINNDIALSPERDQKNEDHP
jgi:Predicted membrane protein